MGAGLAMTATVLALLGADTVAPVRADLAAGYRAAQELGGCIERRPELAEGYETAMTRFWTVYERAEGLFGVEIGDGASSAWVLPEGQASCDGARPAEAAARADAAFDAAEARLAAIEADLSRGLWVGVFPLCADTVRVARVGTDEFGAPAAEIVVKPRHARQLRAYSKRFVRADVTSKPAVRLNGAAMSAPVELPLGPGLTLTGAGSAELSAAVDQARAACPVVTERRASR